jgi:hypothetical protein
MRIARTEIDGGQRFQVIFIMGTDKAIIRDRSVTDGCGSFAELRVPLGESVSEENFEDMFADLSEALCRSGRALPGDRILCTTYPEGSRIVRAGGAA